ncbi:MAG: hypothetical protein CMC22_08880 [Flavobacteriaceae bacterium]|nr:hypothetical protein [Flavobacteriaceae bacterium]
MLKYLSSEFLNDFTKFFKKSKNKKLRKNNHQYNVVIEHFSIFFLFRFNRNKYRNLIVFH